MTKERVNPAICPVCGDFMGDITATGLLKNGTLEESYRCSDDINCGSTWTAVYRLLAIKDVEDTRLPEPWEILDDELEQVDLEGKTDPFVFSEFPDISPLVENENEGWDATEEKWETGLDVVV